VDGHLPPLLVVLVAAVAAPLLGEFTSRFGLPIVVLELLLGTLIGPNVLGWADPADGAMPTLAHFGMAFLFFLAGLEIDLVALRGRLPIVLSSWLVGFAIAVAAALALREAGLVQAWLVFAIAASTTALGVLLPILRDSGVLPTPLGQQVMAVGAVGELGPILAMSLALSTQYTAPVQTALGLAFALVIVGVAWATIRASTPRILGVVARMLLQSSQAPIRIAVLMLVCLALLADALGLDAALGALAAGMVIALATRGSDTHLLHLKLEAIGFGFVVPVFFITSGMKLDVGSLFDGRAGAELLAAFVGAVLLTRIPVVAFQARLLGARGALSLGVFSATTLSLVVAIADIAVEQRYMDRAEAAPLVFAGVVTVVVFPALALWLVGASGRGARPRDERDGL
jgi:Kef-type K+ transport system membrane component KefB